MDRDDDNLCFQAQFLAFAPGLSVYICRPPCIRHSQGLGQIILSQLFYIDPFSL